MTGPARYEVSAVLEARAPIHVGGPEAGLAVDRLAAVDGTGHHFLPGSSLAGAIRSDLAGRHVRVEGLWGPEDCSTASAVWVDDARMVNSVSGGLATPEVRDGVAIDLRSGTASHNLLYSTQVLPKGSRFQARITVEARSGTDPTEALTMAGIVARLLTQSGVRVGANATTGMGLLRAEAAELRVTRLDSADGLLQALLEGPEEIASTEWATLPDPPAQASITMPWRPRGPILVSRSLSGSRADTVPLSTADGSGTQHLVLPGSSIKGALRAQAERIVNTMGTPATGYRAVADLFGAAAEPGGSESEDESDGPIRPDARGGSPRKGILYVEEVSSTRGLTGSFLSDAAPSDEDSAPWEFGDHVAIDRWTGGAREGALYCVIEPHATSDGDWDDLRLSVSGARLEEGRRQAALALLVLVLGDLADGWFGIGYGTARGYGAIDADLSKSTVSGLVVGAEASIGASERTLAELARDAAFKDWLKSLWGPSGVGEEE